MRENFQINLHFSMPKKMVSVILVLLMIVNLIPITLLVTPEAAAATKRNSSFASEIATLVKTAVDKNELNYTAPSPSNNNQTITDTGHGYVYAICKLIQKEIQYQYQNNYESSKTGYQEAVRDKVKTAVNNQLSGSYKGKVDSLIEKMCYVGTYTYTSANKANKGEKNKTSTKLSDKSALKVTVQRNISNAMCDYSLSSAPSSVETSFSFSYSLSVSAATKDVDCTTYYYDQYYYIKDIPDITTASPNSTDATNISNLASKVNEFISKLKTIKAKDTTKTILDNSPMPDYDYLVANYSVDELNSKLGTASSAYTLYNDNKSITDYASTVFIYWIGRNVESGVSASEVTTKLDNYKKDCSKAYLVKSNLPYITAFKNGIKKYFNNENATAEEITVTDFINDSTKRKEVDTLYNSLYPYMYGKKDSEGKEVIKGLNNLDANTKAVLTTAGYNEAAFKKLLTVLLSELDRYDIRVQRDKLLELEQTYTAFSYEEGEEPADGIVYDYTNESYKIGNKKPYSDDSLSNARKEIKSAIEAIDKKWSKNSAYITSDSVLGSKYTSKTDNFYVNVLDKNILWEINRRGFTESSVDYYTFFVPAMYSTYDPLTEAEAPSLSAYIMSRITAAEEQLDELNADINASKNALGEETTKIIYAPFATDSSYTYLSEEADAYINNMYAIIEETFLSEVDTALFLARPYTDGEGKTVNINLSNYSDFTGLYNSIKELYDWMSEEHPDKLTDSMKTAYTQVSGLITAYTTFYSQWKLDNLKKTTPNYPTRYGDTSDYARTLGDDYTVNSELLSDTITKLDTFLTSEDFADFLDLDIEGDERNLSVFIDQLLGEKLFNDEMVNTIFATLYTKIQELLDDTLQKVIDDLNGENGYSLGDLGVSKDVGTVRLTLANGYLTLSVDGKDGTADFVDLFNELGIYVYPSQLRDYFAQFADESSAKYDPVLAAVYDAFNKACGTNAKVRVWDSFIPQGESKVKFDFDWGVDEGTTTQERFNLFCDALGKIFEPLKPLLSTILGDATFSGDTSGCDKNAAYVYVKNIQGKTVGTLTGWDLASATIEYCTGYGDISLSIAGANAYSKVWIPIIEALGIETTTDSSKAIRKINSGSSTADMVKALFDPIMQFIDEMKNQPVERVLSVLPNIAYFISFDGITNLLKSLEINFNIKLAELQFTDFKATKYSTINDILLDVLNSNLVSKLLAKIDINKAISLGDSLDLGDLLECSDMKDINAVLRAILRVADYSALELPLINAGDLIVLADVNKSKSSIRSGGTRTYFEADTGAVFYTVFRWLMASADDILTSAMRIVNQGKVEKGKEPTDIPEQLISIVNSLAGQPDKALAALVEVINPAVNASNTNEGGYPLETINWTSTDYETEPASVVYLAYNNDWNEEKAQYIVDNLEEIVISVLKASGAIEEGTDTESYIQNKMSDGLESAFTNAAITRIAKELVKLDDSIGETLNNVIFKETGVDLLAWDRAFGYLLDDTPKTTQSVAMTVPVRGDDGTWSAGSQTVNLTYDKENDQWSVNGKPLVDKDIDTFSEVFCALLTPASPIISFLFNCEEISLFSGAIKVLSYEDIYENSIEPLFEAIGIDLVDSIPEETPSEERQTVKLLKQDAFKNKYFVETYDPTGALNYLIQTLFSRINQVIDDPINELFAAVPDLINFLYCDGLKVSIKNLIHPLLVLVDTVSPLLGDVVDVNKYINTAVADAINDKFEKVEGSDDYVEPSDISFNINDLSLNKLLEIADRILDAIGGNYAKLDISPILSQAFKLYNYKVEEGTHKSTITPADTITLLVCTAIELLQYGDNAEAIDSFLKADSEAKGLLPAIISLFKADYDESYMSIDWMYIFRESKYLEEDEGYQNAEDKEQYDFFAAIEAGTGIDLSDYHTINYLKYSTDWTKDIAEYLDEHLVDIAVELVNLTKEDNEKINDLSGFVNGLNIYSENTINIVAKFLQGVLAQLDTSEDRTIIKLLDKMLDSGYTLETILDYGKAEGEEPAQGEDEEDVIVPLTRDEFINNLTNLLAPAAPILEFALLGRDIELFNASGIVADTSGKAIISLKGAQGYKYGIIPILEALGCMNVKPESDFVTDEEGVVTYDGAAMLQEIITQLCNVVDYVIDPTVESGNTKDEQMIANALGLMPNLIYFINSNGLTASVNNALKAVIDIAEEYLIKTDDEDNSGLTPAELKEKKAALLDETIGYRISDLSLDYFIQLVYELTMVEDEESRNTLNPTGFNLQPISGELSTLYIGSISKFNSASGTVAYRMDYNDNENRADMLTIITSFILELISYDETAAAKIDALIGSNLFSSAVALLKEGVTPEYSTSLAKYYSEQTVPNYLSVETDWDTTDSEAVIAKATDVLNIILTLTQDENQPDDGLTPVERLITVNLYTDENINLVLGKIRELLSELPTSIINFACNMIGCDITEILTDVADGTVTDKASFVAALSAKLNEAKKLISFLLLGENYRFFDKGLEEVSENAEEVVVEANALTEENLPTQLFIIYGGEGYEYALKPILKALDCDTSALDTAYDDYKTARETYDGYIGGYLASMDKTTADGYLSSANAAKAAKEAAEEAFVSALVNSICTKIDAFMDNPVETVMDVLPELIFYINADGLKLSANNLLKPVTTVIDRLNTSAEKSVVDISSITNVTDNLSLAWIIEQLEDAVNKKINDENYKFEVPADIDGFLTTLYFGVDAGNIDVSTGITLENFMDMDITYGTEKGKNTKGDMLTVLLSVAIDVCEKNINAIDKLLGAENEGKALSIYAILQGATPEYINTKEYAAADPKSTAYLMYLNDWTKESADYFVNNADVIVDYILNVLDAEDMGTVSELISKLDSSIYTRKNVSAIANAIKNAVLDLNKTLGDNGSSVINLVGQILCTDSASFNIINHLDDFTGSNVEKYSEDRDGFISAVTDMLKPFSKALNVLLLNGKYEFFVDYAGQKKLITFNGGYGYAKAVEPLLNALGCDTSSIATTDATPLLTGILNSVADRIDGLGTADATTGTAQPVNKAITMLKGAIEYVNAGGLQMTVYNLAAPVLAVVNELNKAGIEIDISEFTDTVDELSLIYFLGIAEDELNITVPENIKSFVDSLKFEGEITNGDIVTILVSIVLELAEYEDNAAKIDAALETDGIVEKVATVLKGVIAEKGDYFTLNSYEASNVTSYLADVTWNSVAEKLLTDKDSVIAAVLALTGSEKTDLSGMIKVDVFTSENLAKIIKALQDALKDESGNYTGLYTTVKAAANILGCDIDSVLNYNVEPYDGSNRTQFINQLTNAIAPLNKLLTVLLLGDSYKLFNKSFTGEYGEDLVKLIGGNGYEMGLKPLLTALGCNTEKIDEAAGKYTNCALQISAKEAEGKNITVEYINASTELDAAKRSIAELQKALEAAQKKVTECDALIATAKDKEKAEAEHQKAIEAVKTTSDALNAAHQRLDAATGNLENIKQAYNELSENPEIAGLKSALELAGKGFVSEVLNSVADKLGSFENDPIGTVLPMLRSTVSYLNAGGIATAVKNVIAPVYAICRVLGVDASAITEAIDGIDTGMLLDETEKALGIVITDDLKAIIEKLDFSDMSDAQMVTVVIGILIEIAEYDKNAAVLDEKLGADGMVTKVISVLKGEIDVTATDDYSDLNNYSATAVDNKSIIYFDYSKYTEGNLWTADKAQYLTTNVNAIIEAATGKQISELVTLDIYTQKNFDTIMKALKDAYDGLDDNVKTLLPYAFELLGCDIDSVLNYTPSVTIDSREDFISELTKAFAQLNKALAFLFVDGDYTFLYNSKGESEVTIHGGDGYTYALKTVLTALGCDELTDLTEENFLTKLLTSVADRIDEILKDPVNEVLDILPEVIYFMNAQGVEVTVKNLLAPVYKLLGVFSEEGKNPIDNIYTKLVDINMNYLLELAEKAVNDKTTAKFEIPAEIKTLLASLFFGEIKENDVLPTYKTVEVSAVRDVNYYGTKDEMVTLLLNILTETATYKSETADNPKAIDQLMNSNSVKVEGIVNTLSPTSDFEYDSIVWVDMTEVEKTDTFLKYNNNWNAETAKYVAANVDKIAGKFLAKYKDGASSIEDLIGIEIYSAATMNLIVDALNDALKDIDPVLVATVAKMLNISVNSDYPYFAQYSAEAVITETTFKTALADFLTNFETVIGLVLMDKDVTLFIDSAEEATITVNGALGYKYGIVPILEAFGCTNVKADFTKTADKTETRLMIEELVSQLCSVVNTYITADMLEGEKPIQELLKNLPNILYFINSDGLSTCVENVLKSVDYLLEGIGNAIGKQNMSVNSLIEGFDLANINFFQIIELMQNKNILDLEAIEPYIVNFYLGDILSDVNSANGNTWSRMVYPAETDVNTYTADVLTTVLCLASVVVTDEANEEQLIKLLGSEEAYAVLMGVFDMREFDMEPIKWINTDKAGTGYVFSILETTEVFSSELGPKFTKEMANEIGENIGGFTDSMVSLLGLEVNGESVGSLKELLNGYIGESVCTKENAQKILDALRGLVDKIYEEIPAADDLMEIIERSLDVKIRAYDRTKPNNTAYANMDKAVADIVEGDMDSFINSMKIIIEPFYPLLKWLLCDEDISFLVRDENGTDAVTLLGADGYKYGVIPLLEALYCDNINGVDYIKSREDFVKEANDNPASMIDNILTPVLEKIDYLLEEDPAGRLMEILPNVIYFMNSKGLDTCWKNILHAVYGLLDLIKVDSKDVGLDLYQLLGFKEELTFDSISGYLFEYIAKETGYNLSTIVLNEINELTAGVLNEYLSTKSGMKSYRMEHAEVEEGEIKTSGELSASLLRILFNFIGTEENGNKLKAMLKENENVSDEAYGFYAAMIDMVRNYCTSPDGMDTMMYVLYEVFTRVNGVSQTVDGFLESFNGRYRLVLDSVSDDESSVIKDFVETFKKLFNENVVSDEGVATNGLVKFFQGLIEGFKNIFSKIGELFKNFGKNRTTNMVYYLPIR